MKNEKTLKTNKISINGEINFSVKNAVYLFLIGFLGVTFVFNLIFTGVFRNLYETDPIKYYFKCNLAIYICTFVSLLIYLAVSKVSFKKALVSWKQIFFGLIIGGLLIGFSFLVGYLSKGISGSNTNQEIAIGVSTRYKFPSILILGIIGPICEELTYRCGLFEMCKKLKNRALAYIVTTLLFALIHFDFMASDMKAELVSLIVYLFGGFALSFAYDKLGLVGSATAHILNNILSILL